MNLGLTGMPEFLSWGPHPARSANAAIAKRMDLFKSSSKVLERVQDWPGRREPRFPQGLKPRSFYFGFCGAAKAEP